MAIQSIEKKSYWEENDKMRHMRVNFIFGNLTFRFYLSINMRRFYDRKMDFFEKHLRETLKTISTCNNEIITVKRLRKASKIKSSDRSKINFTWRALKSLVGINFLELNGSKT